MYKAERNEGNTYNILTTDMVTGRTTGVVESGLSRAGVLKFMTVAAVKRAEQAANCLLAEADNAQLATH